jgi:AcrR family transcriptional regulator
VPRDAHETRARLLREAERLFARRGVWQVTVREITEAAAQRNPSALHYHFGSREGILQAILQTHGDPIDDARGAWLGALGDEPRDRDLVAALLVPYSTQLATDAGRDYLRIVAQLTVRFARWETEVDAPNLVRILQLLRDRQTHLPPAVRAERVVGAIVLLSSAFAERARAMETGAPLDLDDDEFLANLADMIVGVLEAPMGAPLRPSTPAPVH